MVRCRGRYQKQVGLQHYGNDEFTANESPRQKSGYKEVIPKFDRLFFGAVDSDESSLEALPKPNCPATKLVDDCCRLYDVDDESTTSSYFTSGNDTFDRLLKESKQCCTRKEDNALEAKKDKEESFDLFGDSASLSSPPSLLDQSRPEIFSSPKSAINCYRNATQKFPFQKKKNTIHKLPPKKKDVIPKASLRKKELIRKRPYRKRKEVISRPLEMKTSSADSCNVMDRLTIDFGAVSICKPSGKVEKTRVPSYLMTSTPAALEKVKQKLIQITELSPVQKGDSFSCFQMSSHNVSPLISDSHSSASSSKEGLSHYVSLANEGKSHYVSFTKDDLSPQPRDDIISSKGELIKDCDASLECEKVIGCDLPTSPNILLDNEGKWQPISEVATISRVTEIKSSLNDEYNLGIMSTSHCSLDGRRNMLQNFLTKRSRKCPQLHHPSFLFTSIQDKKFSSSFLNCPSKSPSNIFMNDSSKGAPSRDASIIIKGGKGWRRSIKKSIHNKMMSFQDSVSSVEAFPVRPPFITEFQIGKSFISDWSRFILDLCNQNSEMSFAKCFSEEIILGKKIGEGLYGEVFLSSNANGDSTVVKIMPIEGSIEVNGEPQKSFEEVAGEVVVSLELSKLATNERKNSTASFVSVLRVRCLQGAYTAHLLQLWDQYYKENGSENDRPTIFPEDQKYVAIEFCYAGKDLESFVFNNASQAYAAFVQIASGLAVAEEELQFEHRDLHWGNVLIEPSSQMYFTTKLKGKIFNIRSCGIKASIIDYTLSRICMMPNNCIFFNDLSQDPSVFQGHGDYQFEIYRLMRNANGNNWKAFTPVTNIFWLHYLIKKMIQDCYFKNKETKIHKKGLEKLKEVEEKIMNCKSAVQLFSQLEDFS